MSPQRARGTAMDYHQQLCYRQQIQCIIEGWTEVKEWREEKKLPPEKIKMLTSKGNLNHDQKDSKIESSHDSVADKCWEENKKSILL